jgi:hypothetical protein
MPTPTFTSTEATRDFYAAAIPVRMMEDTLELSDDEGQETGQITALHQGVPLIYPTYSGKSGNESLVQHVLSVKQDKADQGIRPFSGTMMSLRFRRPEFWSTPPVSESWPLLERPD